MRIIFRSFLFILVGPFIFSQGFFGQEFPEPKIKYAQKPLVCNKELTPKWLDAGFSNTSNLADKMNGEITRGA